MLGLGSLKTRQLSSFAFLLFAVTQLTACSGFSPGLLATAKSVTGRTFATPAGGRCFQTGGLTVCHNPGDEGVFFDTPQNMVAYNAQVVKLSPTDYLTVYHSESKDSWDRQTPRPGDSIRVGLQQGPFSYQMPPTNYAIWGSLTDPLSNLYYGIGTPNANAGGASGGGNPMIVTGRPGDPYKYMFFLGVSDGFRYNANDWQHTLHVARTVDFANWDVLSMAPNGQESWQPFTHATAEWQRRPLTLTDASGAAIMSAIPNNIHSTQGLIGSISYVNGLYYYFYTDQNPANPNETLFYVRTSSDISMGKWSHAMRVGNEVYGTGTMIRVAKARGMERWSVVYGCYSPTTGISDLCVQYTENLNLEGPGSIGSLTLFANAANQSHYNLGIEISDCNNSALRAQHYMLTDLNGNLEAPLGEEDISRGGVLTWMDMCTGAPYGAPMYRAGWTVVGASPEAPAPQPAPAPAPQPQAPAPQPAPQPQPQAPQPAPAPAPSAGSTAVNLVYRSYNAGNQDHLFSLVAGEGAPAYALEGPVFTLYKDGGPGRLLIYRCLITGTGTHFLSAAPNCEGNQVDGPLGYVSTSPTGEAPSALHRCYSPSLNRHFVSKNPGECTAAGYNLVDTLGYGG